MAVVLLAAVHAEQEQGLLLRAIVTLLQVRSCYSEVHSKYNALIYLSESNINYNDDLIACGRHGALEHGLLEQMTYYAVAYKLPIPIFHSQK